MKIVTCENYDFGEWRKEAVSEVVLTLGEGHGMVCFLVLLKCGMKRTCIRKPKGLLKLGLSSIDNQKTELKQV